MLPRGIKTLALASVLVASCGGPQPAPTSPPPTPTTTEMPPAASTAPSFRQDEAFLRKFGDVIVLESQSGARVLVSPTYQARVMTSAVAPDGPSLGWIHRSFIEQRKTGTQFDNYGGEDRFWLGPEGGQFGLYFPPGKPFTFEHWQTPASFQEGAWKVVDQSPKLARFQQPIQVTNHTGTQFQLAVDRTIELLDASFVSTHLSVALPDGLQLVAYQTVNEVTNTGPQPWTREGGLLSIWVLGMYPPSADTVVIVPFETSAPGPVVNDNYFGKVPAERLVVDEKAGVLFFRCDAQHRSKIGLSPERSKPVLGSYSPSARMLTVVSFDGPVAGAPYVNSMWEQQDAPHAGDVVNSYNDGPTEPGKPALGGFYEIETSSPAMTHAAWERLRHTHRTMHIVGDEAKLEPIARKLFGVSLAAVRERMK